ncbi:MarR family transcriptional regulator [bacterium]|nr:MarR family transcriptional regulator [bacterium]
MSLEQELGFRRPLSHPGGATVLNIVHTGNLLVKEGDRVFKPLGLTNAWFDVLMLVRWQSENGRISQSELGRMLLVNRSNVTGLVDRMERAGLVRRVAEPGDRRVNLVELTEAGGAALDRAYKVYIERIGQVLSGLQDSDLRSLTGLLERVREGVNG